MRMRWLRELVRQAQELLGRPVRYGGSDRGGAGSAPRGGRLGPRGERAAARYIRRRGYRIVARNFRAAGAEIDLVALDGPTLVFIEVKTRLADRAGAPEEAVDWRKQNRLRRAAAIYGARHRADDRPMRFDVVAISGQGRGRRVEIFKDAF